MIEIRVDTKDAMRHFDRLEALAGPARVRMLRDFGDRVVEQLARTSPRDTNRYVRGWIDAGNQAGLGTRRLPTIKQPRDTKFGLERLITQHERARKRVVRAEKSLEFWDNILTNRYERTGRRGRWRRDASRKRAAAKRTLVAATKQFERARQILLDATGTDDGRGATLNAGVIVIGGRKTKKATSLSSLASVRTKPIGGEGQMLILGGRLVLRLANLEPHARIVERRHRVMRRAAESLRRLGLARVTAAELRRLGVRDARAS